MMKKYRCCFLLIILFSSNSSVLSEEKLKRPPGLVIRVFPWLCAIEIRPKIKGELIGNIISDEWILTSAHAIQNATAAMIYPEKSHVKSGSGLVYRTTKLYVNPDYNPENYDADLGLIQLEAKLIFNELVQPVKLHDLIFEISADVIVTIPTWEKKKPSYIEVPVISNEECSKTYGFNIPEGNFCAMSGPNNDSCAISIEGAPATVNFEGEKRLVGVHTFVVADCEKSNPIGFTRLFPHWQWISNISGVV